MGEFSHVIDRGDILCSDEYSVVRFYEKHGFNAWFVQMHR